MIKCPKTGLSWSKKEQAEHPVQLAHPILERNKILINLKIKTSQWFIQNLKKKQHVNYFTSLLIEMATIKMITIITTPAPAI